MSSEVAISVQHLSKCYHVYEKPQDRLKQAILPRLRRSVGLTHHNYFREFWALRDVSFEIMRGETAGILGRNGSGKSTLLQMICGTLTPTSGSVQTNGRIAALLELGSGFNPEFSGRENIFLNGTILGMSQAEIEQRFDDIAAFADIGDHLEQPVKTYSSGMYVRLAFAVNIMSQPQIMVVDEALAVGDMNFQAKCMTALSRIQDNGATILFVSHDIGSVKSLCTKAVYLDRGNMRDFGPAPEIARRYVQDMRSEMNEETRQFSRVSADFDSQPPLIKRGPVGTEKAESGIFKTSDSFDKRVKLHRYGSGGAAIRFVELVDENDLPLEHVEFDQSIRVRIYVEAHSRHRISVNFYILDEKRISITGCGFSQAEQSFLDIHGGDLYLVEYTLKLPLAQGRYSVTAHITEPLIENQTANFLDVIEDAVVFQIGPRPAARLWTKVHLHPQLKITQTH